MKNLRTQHGTTLIETILYFALAATILLVITSLYNVVLQTRARDRAFVAVEEQGALALMEIATAVHNAEAITAPTIGTSSTTLTIDAYTGSADPMVFDLSGSTLREKKGAAAAVALTAPTVVVSSLTFQNIARASTPGAIRITFTLSYTNPLNSADQLYSKTFTTTAAVRQP